MVAARKPQRLLLEVMAKLGEVRIRERYIPGDLEGEIVYGTYDNGRVEINPVPSLVNTVIHECLHALYPAWTETTVRRMTTLIHKRLSDEELRTIYRVYQRRASGTSSSRKD